jgi:hypothetical protein
MSPPPRSLNAGPLLVDALVLRRPRLALHESGISSCMPQGCSEVLERPIRVVGMGSSGQDLLALVAAFPRPDDKLRTEKFEAQVGLAQHRMTAGNQMGSGVPVSGAVPSL